MRLARMIQAVDAHAAGEPGRVIVGGVLDVPGATMFEKKLFWEAHRVMWDEEYWHLENLMNLEQIGRPHGFQLCVLPIKWVHRIQFGTIREVGSDVLTFANIYQQVIQQGDYREARFQAMAISILAFPFFSLASISIARSPSG